VARTIADLSASKRITPPHVAEALSLRCLDRRD
jgi:predicted ATPase with chaperone activity